MSSNPKQSLTLESVARQLEAMRGKAVTSTGQWSAARVFRHNAQSIDYSLTGFPEPKSKLFQSVIGKTAFAVFSARGEMRHGLAEPIPGASAIPDGGSLDEAIDVLLASIARFQANTGTLHPHFAYGELSKAEYDRAHTLHFLNHLSEIVIPATA